MKLTLVPYLLICWLLIKFGVVRKTVGNFVAMGLGAVFVLFALLTVTRYFAFIDLTATTTVKAPHIVLNSPAGGEINKLYVTHNQKLKAGDPVYSFNTDRYEIQMAAKKAEKARLQTQLGKLEKDLKRLGKLRGEVIPQAEYDAKVAEVETQRDLVIKAEQDMADLQWKIDKALSRRSMVRWPCSILRRASISGRCARRLSTCSRPRSSSNCVFPTRPTTSSNPMRFRSFMSMLIRERFSGHGCIASRSRPVKRRAPCLAVRRA
jgi:multidrug efflux pump subunit AcrA (membrane-fusion protein)